MAKKQSNQEKAIMALDALDKTVRNLQMFAARYDRYIDEAALRQDDQRAKQLIKQKIRVYALIEQLKTLKENIDLGVFTSHAISELGALPIAIAGCRGLLAESPDFSKLGKNIAAIFNDMNKSEEEIANLNNILAPKSHNSITSHLDGVADDENTTQFNAEYAAMIERLKNSIATEGVAKPDIGGMHIAGVVDYAGIIREENNKK